VPAGASLPYSPLRGGEEGVDVSPPGRREVKCEMIGLPPGDVEEAV